MAVAHEVGADDRGIVDEAIGEGHGEHHTGREPGERFIVGDLPEPGAVAAAQNDRGGDRAPIEQDAVDRDLSFRGKPHRRRADEAAKLLVAGRGGAGFAFPAARLDGEEILDRRGDARRLRGRRKQHGADIGEAPADAAQLLMPARSQRPFDIVRALAARRQQRPLVAIEIGARRLRAPQDCFQGRGERTVLRKERQQQHARQLRVRGEMRQPCGNDRFGGFALDQRHPKRGIGVGPAEQHRQSDAVTPRRDPRRKKSEQAARRARRPDQDGAGSAPEHRRRGECEGGLVERVGLEHIGGKLAPFAGDRCELGEIPPFDDEGVGRITLSERGAAHARYRRGGAAFKRQRQGLIGRCLDRHRGARRYFGPPKMKQCRPRRYLATRNRLINSTVSATALAIAAPTMPSHGINPMHSPILIANAPA